MKIVSWNINSLRLRLSLLKKFVAENAPDVVCLQEIKVQDADFPLLEVKSLGFEFVEFFGEKSYNGVAILSKFPLTKIEKIDVLSYGHKRHISAALQTKVGEVFLHNFYVPAGGDIPDVSLNDKFDHKLKFVDWMSDYFAPQKDKKIIILGDMNIAPLEHDVWSHKQLLKIVSHTPIEVEKMTRLQQTLNWIDTHRHFVDESQKLYSWWSYRAKDPLGANKGRRLDHIWATPNLKNQIKSMKIYKDFRSETQPSDHVPIETVFDFS
ncbi:MAG: exodeoxyribonuclease III [Rickettsiales bacterium]|nr:exodeoxyribonuclease III [Rickettsiales bacterium]